MSYDELVSGRMTGIGAALGRTALALLSLPYITGVHARNRAFDFGLKPAHRAAVPVISVGNVTTGGTGKTPFVAWLVNWFVARGIRPAILSRGYRSLDGEANDEKRVLDQLCPGVPHLQHPDRVASAERAVREHGAQVLVLDDAFQHRRLARDLDIVLVDTLNPWGYGYLLPRGLLREPLSSLRRADLVVLTRVDRCSPAAKTDILSDLQRAGGPLPPAEIAYPPERLLALDGRTTELESLRGRRVAAFCGIGNPPAFLQMLDDQDYEVAHFDAFPDHHHYTSAEVQQLAAHAQAAGCEALVTTQKDLVKIGPSAAGALPLWAVQIGARIVEGGGLLETRLAELARRIG